MHAGLHLLLHPCMHSFIHAFTYSFIPFFLLSHKQALWPRAVLAIGIINIITRLAQQECLDMQVTMHVCVFVFDLLYVDGDALVRLPLRQRRARLAAALPHLQPGHMQLATSIEFRPEAVCMAVAASASKEASAASGAQASQNPQQTGNRTAAESTSGDAGFAGAVRKDAVMSDMTSSGRAAKPAGDLPQHTPGGGDVDATGVAAEAAQGAMPLAAAASASAEGAAKGAAEDEVEDLVSDLAVQSMEDKIQEFLLESFAGGTEGLMLKALDGAAGYQPSKRSDSWIKLKRQARCYLSHQLSTGHVSSAPLRSFPGADVETWPR